MPLADMLPDFDDASLLNLRRNAVRLISESGLRHDEAVALLPLIEAEIAKRDAERPPKVPRRVPHRRGVS